MNRNPVSAAIELVETVPSNEFRSTLRAQLMAGITESATTGTAASQRPNATLSDADEEYIELIPTVSRVGPNRRFARTLLAAAACLAVFTAVAVIVSRAGDPPSAIELHNVNQPEALRLAQRALIAGDALVMQWSSNQAWVATELPNEATATIAALPDCAQLRSVGLLPPTAKSAAAYQYVSGTDLLRNNVFVFATAEDASRAMDVIAGENYRTCWFNLFDRDAFHSFEWTSTSEPWDAPTIASHGDQQIIFGQHTTLLIRFSRKETYLINAYVRVGRAITLINPRVLIPGDLFAVNKAVTAATDALTRAVGP